MSFPRTYAYIIRARDALRACTELDSELAESLHAEVNIYFNPEMLSNRVISDAEHEAAVKLVFVANYREFYDDNFFAGKSELSTDFFDRWWMIQRTDDFLHMAAAMECVTAADFDTISKMCSKPLAASLAKLRANARAMDPLREMDRQ
ncbi:hypothetical protein [Stieleria varia]|uniref:Uncharacterized protein n=1 Tax=Stieleria varia TaxID=2528005 RepID=A0A5C6APL0_9BACT|nr:hypothetical protein [Stieleria varia]TWU01056.1 hypothetical protein Pla52n_44270 [Stieleria varia]